MAVAASWSSLLLATVVLAALIAGVWCSPDSSNPESSLSITVEKGYTLDKLHVRAKFSIPDDDTVQYIYIKGKGEKDFLQMAHVKEQAGNMYSFKRPGHPAEPPLSFQVITRKYFLTYNFLDLVPANYEVGHAYTAKGVVVTA